MQQKKDSKIPWQDEHLKNGTWFQFGPSVEGAGEAWRQKTVEGEEKAMSERRSRAGLFPPSRSTKIDFTILK